MVVRDGRRVHVAASRFAMAPIVVGATLRRERGSRLLAVWRYADRLPTEYVRWVAVDDRRTERCAS
jgi:hypothetical protein